MKTGGVVAPPLRREEWVEVSRGGEYNGRMDKIEKLKELACDGDAEAQWRLGCYYRDDDVRPMAKKMAFTWFWLAAQQGHTGAQACLGWAYHHGEGVKKDEVEALRWLKKAAKGGVVGDQYYLGLCYRDGIGVRKNMGFARKWLEKAALAGHKEAKKALGEARGRARTKAGKTNIQ
jgi:TPR repeat protein